MVMLQMLIPVILLLLLSLVLTATDQRYLFSLRKFLTVFSIGLVILIWTSTVSQLAIVVVALIYIGLLFMR